MITSDRLKTLPSEPGVYMMKDGEGNIIYVGKAKDLRKRLRSYLPSGGNRRYTMRYLLSRVEDLEYIVTRTEKEALILENTLIKKNKPRYNINLRDDKTYISLRMDPGEDFPRITMVRRVKKDGARYFGPYSSANSVRETLRAMYKIFPLRTCSDTEFKRRDRPCINFGMKRCLAPCVGLIEKNAYGDLVKGAVLFLVGKNLELLKSLRNRMKDLSDRLRFEEAAMLRNRIRAIEITLERQRVFIHTSIDQDVIGVYSEEMELAIQILSVRKGRLMGGRKFYFHSYEMPLEELLSSFIIQYYSCEKFIPQEVILPVYLEDNETIEGWLREKNKDRKIKVVVPERGDRLKLLQMAERNAQEAMRKIEEGRKVQEDVIRDLMKALSLRRSPRRIEAIDVSNLHGTEAVGAMVTFKDGNSLKNDYRLFRIKSVQGIDDYGMIREIISRRYTSGHSKKMPVPDLVMVDGGKGHLRVVMEVLKEFKKDDLDIIAFAKAREGEAVDKVYLPDRRDPVLLDKDSPSYLFLQRIRDEAHRFAIGYHRGLRKKKITSILMDITGVGKRTCVNLLIHFGSVKNIKKASLEDLCKVYNIRKKVADNIYKTFHT